jgi:signal transduction histidine kinase/CheY-like chemotaxis protein
MICWLLAAALAVAPAMQPVAAQARSEPAPPLNPSFRHYGVLDGLPSDAAYMAVQDKSGYIWIGTRDGLARFDGSEFRIFRHDGTDPDSIAANDVSAVLVDAQGNVWAGGEGNGLNLYLPDSGGFRHWQHDSRDASSLSGNDVMALAQSPDGSIWVGIYAGGLDRLRADRRGFEHFRHRERSADSLLSNIVTALAADARGGLWIGTEAGVQFRDAQGRFTRVALPGVNGPVSVWQLNSTGDGVDAATDVGLFHINADLAARRIGPAASAYASLRDRHGDIWIARQDGIDLVAADGTTRHYAPHNGVPSSLSGTLAVGLLRDHEGGIWIALLDGGVAYLPPHWRAFDAWRHQPDDPDSMAPGRVRALALAPDGTLLAGGSKGLLDLLDPRDGHIRHLSSSIGLPDSSISALAQDARGRLWIGHRHGLRVLDGTHARDIGVGDPSLRHGVWTLLIARNGAVYFAGVGTGVTRVDPDDFSLLHMQPPGAIEAAQQISQLREAGDGSIWAGSQAGLARLAPGADTFRFVPGVGRGAVDAFAFGADGSLWLARSDRLQHYTLHNGRARRLDTVNAADGWPTVEVGGLETTADGRVWASTPRGLVVYDPQARRAHLYAAASGLGNPELALHTLLRNTDGSLYVGSFDGVMAIRPGALRDRRMPPQMASASLSVRREGRTVQLDPTKPVALHWDDRELAITAHALSFVDPKQVHYRFMLSGFDPDWVDTGERDTREFSSLPAGDYTLRIAAAFGDGPWSAASTPIALHVPAPPWDTPLAWGTYALLALLGVLAFIHALRRRLEQHHRFAMIAQRQQLAEQANAAKTDFLAGMAHEIRTPMTGVLGMAELLLNTALDERQRGYADAIRRSGALLMRQLNDALDLARIEAGKLELAVAPFDPAALLREIASIEQGLATQKGLSLRVAIANDAPRALQGDALRVQQVLLNLAHNALKFTQAGGVRLSLDRDAAGVVFAVADSGPGLSPHECERVFRRFEQTESGRRAHGSGLGLTIARELVALMDGRIELHSEVGVGSTFRVHLPLPECAPPAPRQVPAVATSAGDSKRVLLVDDDDVAAEVLAGLLQAQGHSVTRAPHALAALSEVDAARAGFDMILLDLDLPGMDGCTLAGMLRARGLEVPMLAVTASSRGDEEQRIRAAGMDALLRKPVLPETLSEAMEKVSGDS